MDIHIGGYDASSQTLANLTASPADGTGQTDSDLWFGADGDASTDDPTFNEGSPNYVEFDGGDYFSPKVEPHPGIASDWHKGTQDWWLAWYFKTPVSFNPSGAIFCSDVADTGAYGLTLQFISNYFRYLRYINNSLSGINNFTSCTFSLDTWHFVCVTYDNAGNKLDAYLDSRSITQTVTSAFPDTSAVGSTRGMYFNTLNTLGSKANSGTQFAFYSGGNSYLAADDVGNMIDVLNDRYGVTIA